MQRVVKKGFVTCELGGEEKKKQIINNNNNKEK